MLIDLAHDSESFGDYLDRYQKITGSRTVFEVLTALVLTVSSV